MRRAYTRHPAHSSQNGDDIWIVSLEEAVKENNEVATVEANANAIQVLAR